MKKLFIVLFALMTGMTWAQQSPVTAGSDGKSWTLATRSFIYQIRVSDQGKVNMFYFGDKSQNPDMLRNPLGEEVTVRGGYSATTPMLEAVFKDRGKGYRTHLRRVGNADAGWVCHIGYPSEG